MSNILNKHDHTFSEEQAQFAAEFSEVTGFVIPKIKYKNIDLSDIEYLNKIKYYQDKAKNLSMLKSSISVEVIIEDSQDKILNILGYIVNKIIKTEEY